jgi:CDP-glucose 4,6-dehydratase
MIINNFYKNKRVLITGHTGFKGSWLTLFLNKLGAKVCGIALPPNYSEDFYVVNKLHEICESNLHNITDYQFVKKIIIEFQPDVVLHLAAQALVRQSYLNPLETYQTNVIGTANLLEAIKEINKKCSVVVITTDKVYENKEWHYPYRESDRLGGNDPYSSSKACAELVVSSYRNSFFSLNKFDDHKKSIATARAGNVIGGGDWSNDRLIPDIIRAIRSNNEIIIRNPKAVRPWQHVLEPLYGYLLLGAKLYENPYEFTGEWNFGPYPDQELKVEEVVKSSISIMEKGSYIVQKDLNAPHEATLLKLDISKTLNCLGWKPILKTEEAIIWTLEWYNECLSKKDNSIIEYSINSIQEYLNKLSNESSNNWR